MTLWQWLHRLLPCVLALALTTPSQPARGADLAGTWSTEVQGSQRWLYYKTTAKLLGKATPVEVAFFCDPLPNQFAESSLGIQWVIKATASLKPFNFSVFETPPPALANNQLLDVVVTRKGKPALEFKAKASGVEPSKGFFIFDLTAPSKLAVSMPRTILQALAEGGAEGLTLRVTDHRDAKLKLEVSVPVAGKQADFRTLLTGLK